TGRGAEAAMHAGPQDLVGFGDIGIGQLGERKFGFHVALPRSIRPRLRMVLGSKLWRTRWLSAARPPACEWRTSPSGLVCPAPGTTEAGPRPPSRGAAPDRPTHPAWAA